MCSFGFGAFFTVKLNSACTVNLGGVVFRWEFIDQPVTRVHHSPIHTLIHEVVLRAKYSLVFIEGHT